MNIVIVGFGSAGKYYLDILKKNKNIKKIFVIEEKKITSDKFFEQTDSIPGSRLILMKSNCI